VPPHKPSSTGLVYVEEDGFKFKSTFYPSVLDLNGREKMSKFMLTEKEYKKKNEVQIKQRYQRFGFLSQSLEKFIKSQYASYVWVWRENGKRN